MNKLLAILIFVLIIALWAACPYLVIMRYGCPKEPGGFGDVFGSVNALFAGLAFFGIIFSIFQQRAQLKLNTAEVHDSTLILKEQVRLMRLSAKLGALPELIRMEKDRIYTIDMERLSEARNESYTAEQLDTLISGYGEMAETSRKNLEKMDSLPKGIVVKAETGEWTRKELETNLRISQGVIPSLKKLKEYVLDLESAYQEVSRTADNPQGATT